jgi:beta-glucosidase
VLATVQRANVDAARLLRGGGAPVVSSHWVAPLRPALEDAEAVIWDSWSDPESIDAFDMIGITPNPPVTVVAGEDEDGPPFFMSADPEPSPVAVAEGVAEVVDRVSELAPDQPLIVRGTELAVDDDERRVDHLRAVLEALDRSIGAGADIRGYFHWTAVDGYELDGGFATKRGLFDRDRNSRPTVELLPPRDR